MSHLNKIVLSLVVMSSLTLPQNKPERLSPGDTILFIAPSGYLKQDRMALAKKRLEDRGYVTVQADDIFRAYGYLGGTDERRVEELMTGWTNQNIKAIFPVHFAGLPCDMLRIKQIADKYNLAIVEDASHALGATYYDGAMVGNCKYSDMTTLSFHPVKGIAAGEGGMITTNNLQLSKKFNLLKSQGMDISPNSREKTAKWKYDIVDLGYNYRLDEIRSALGLSQMKRLDKSNDLRKKASEYYTSQLSDIPGIIPPTNSKNNENIKQSVLANDNFVKQPQYLYDLF